MTALRARWETARTDCDISPSIQVAREAVREMIVKETGIDLLEDVATLVERLMGPFDAAEPDHIERQWTAFAVGVAIGQLYHPDVFRGAR